MSLSLMLALMLAPQLPTRTVCDPTIMGGQSCVTKPIASTTERCAGRDWLLSGCTVGESRAARAKVDSRKQVTSLLVQGKCEAAVTAALEAGDLAYAREVRDFCAPTSTNIPPK